MFTITCKFSPIYLTLLYILLLHHAIKVKDLSNQCFDSSHCVSVRNNYIFSFHFLMLSNSTKIIPDCLCFYSFTDTKSCKLYLCIMHLCSQLSIIHSLYPMFHSLEKRKLIFYVVNTKIYQVQLQIIQ